MLPGIQPFSLFLSRAAVLLGHGSRQAPPALSVATADSDSGDGRLPAAIPHTSPSQLSQDGTNGPQEMSLSGH